MNIPQEKIELFKYNTFEYGDIGNFYQNLLGKIPNNSVKINDSLKDKIDNFGDNFDQFWRDNKNLKKAWIVDLIPTYCNSLFKNIDITEIRIYYEALKKLGLNNEERFVLAFEILYFIQEEKNYYKFVCSFGVDKLFSFVEKQKQDNNLFFTDKEFFSSKAESSCYNVLSSEGEKVFKEDFYKIIILPIVDFIDSKDKNNWCKNLSNSLSTLGGGVIIFGIITIISAVVTILAFISQFTGFNLQNLWKTDKQSENITPDNRVQFNGNGNLITKIESLEESESLKCLSLYKNKITSIDGINSLYNPNMTSIDLMNNKILDASGIKNLLNEYPKMKIDIEGGTIGCGTDLIKLRNNGVLEPPIDVLKKGREETIKYFQEKP